MGGSGDMPIREAGPDAPGRWINSAFSEGQRAPQQQLQLPEVRGVSGGVSPSEGHCAVSAPLSPSAQRDSLPNKNPNPPWAHVRLGAR